MIAHDTNHMARAAFLGDGKDKRRAIGVVGARLHDETLRRTRRIGMGNQRRHPRDFSRLANPVMEAISDARGQRSQRRGVSMRKISSEVKSGNMLAPAGSLSRGLEPKRSGGLYASFITLAGFPDYAG